MSRIKSAMNVMPCPHVNIVGAGICGLSVAQALKKQFGHDVEITITADKFYDQTTSYAAGGLWEPHLLGDTPANLVLQWSQATYSYYQSLYFSPYAGEAGVQQIKAHNLYSDDDYNGQMAPHPIWAGIQGLDFSVPDQRALQGMGYPSKFTHAHSFTSYVADPHFLLAFLTKSLQEAGVHFEEKNIELIEHQLKERGSNGAIKYDVVVNCTGLGAVNTERDTTMYPIRGQVLRVHAPWIKNTCTFGTSYVIPNLNSVVVGGTGQQGDWNTEVSMEDSKKILDGVCEMFPSLRHAEVLRTNVGLRPCRPCVRLDSEVMTVPRHHDRQQNGQQLLVRCYGLGGSGFTIGHGVALDVVQNHIQPFLCETTGHKGEAPPPTLLQRLLSKL